MNKQPSKEQWRRLYDSVRALKELQPWTYMEETDIFEPLKAELGISVRLVKSIMSFDFAKMNLSRFLENKMNGFF